MIQIKMNKYLLLILLGFGALSVSADKSIDCTDPVTQFVKPEICGQENTTLKTEEKEKYWCYVVTGFFHKSIEGDFKDTLEKGLAEKLQQESWNQSHNFLLYSVLNTMGFEKKIQPDLTKNELFEIIQTKYKSYLKELSGTEWMKELERVAECVTLAPNIFISKNDRYKPTSKEESAWIEAFAKRDSENKIQGIDINSWVAQRLETDSKKYNQKRWIDWQVMGSNLADANGNVGGIPAFEWSKQNYCMEIYGNFDCKE